MKVFRSWRVLLLAGVLVIAGVVAAIAFVRARTMAQQSARDDTSVAAVMDAVFAQDRLWLLLENGRLASLRPDAPAAEVEAVPGSVAGLCKAGALPIALAEDKARGNWRLYAHDANGWSLRQSLPMERNVLVGFACSDKGAIVLTDRRLVSAEGGAIRETSLSAKLDPAIVRATLLADDASLWVGFNNGEWAGA